MNHAQKGRYAWWIVGFFCAAPFAMAGFFYVMLGELACSSEDRKAILSPDRKYSLVISELNCGATTPFYTAARLDRTRWLIWPKAHPPFFSVRGRHDLAIRWTSERTIEIVVPREATVAPKSLEIDARQPNFDGIAVEYK